MTTPQERFRHIQARVELLIKALDVLDGKLLDKDFLELKAELFEAFASLKAVENDLLTYPNYNTPGSITNTPWQPGTILTNTINTAGSLTTAQSWNTANTSVNDLIRELRRERVTAELSQGGFSDREQINESN